MDMDRVARQVSERLAARPSRRGFVAKISQLAIGAGAVFAGLRDADQAAAQISGSCCTGARACTSTDTCDHGTKLRYSWYCTTESGVRYLCEDCNKGKRNICVIATQQ